MSSKEIKSLLSYAVLAPSSHNTQPWAFKIADDSLQIYLDLKRKLKEGDRQGRMLFVSLGCLLFNLKVAAEHAGFLCKINYTNYNNFESKEFCLAANVFFDRESVNLEKDYFPAMLSRRSNRNEHKNLSLAQSDLSMLSSLNQKDNLKIDLITDPSLKSKIAEISSKAMNKIMSDANFRKELASWLRANLSLKKDGMPGSGHCMSLPVSFIAPFILRNINVSKVEAQKEKKRILNFAAVGIISSTNDNPQNWLEAGELLENILLAAEDKKISSVIRVASIEVPSAKEELRTALNLKNFYPQMLFGLGYAKKSAPHSPRRPINDFIIN